MDLLTQFKKYLLQDKTRHSKITVKNYLADIRKFINWFENTFHGEFRPELISKQLVDIYKKEVIKPNSQNQIPAARSIKRYLSSLRKFYSFLIQSKLVTHNPFEIEQVKIYFEADPFHLKEFKNYLVLSKVSNATKKNYMMDISHFVAWIKELPQSKGLDRVDSVLVEEYKNRLLYEAGFSPASVNRKLSSLRKYFAWAKAQEFMHREISFEQVSSLPSVNEAVQQAFLKSNLISPPIAKAENEFVYSKFPPVRMLQKLFRLSNLVFDLIFLVPVVKILASTRYQWWKLKGKKVFTSPIDELVTKQSQVSVKNLSKSFYAPLKVSIKGLPFYKRIIYHLRYTRPLWYRKYHSYRLVHYLHFGILLIYSLFLGFKVYHGLIDSSRMQSAVLGANESVRILSFSGRLTDATNTPITRQSNLRFSLYSDKTASGSALLWQETQIIRPDQDGNFQTALGQKQPLTQNFLTDNPLLFLGITVGSEKELYPRQQIATVAYSRDSEKLQGMLPITDPTAGTSNIILALDSSGNLTIGGSAAPRFEATGGEFTLSGQTLTLTTGVGSNTNIQLNPDGSGIIDLQKPIQNTTNYGITPETEGMVQIADSLGIIAESSTQSALLINQNSTANLISANGAGSAKFTVDYLGNGMFAEDVSINGNNLTSESYTFNLLNKDVFNLNIGNEATLVSIGATSGATIVNNTLDARGQIVANGGLVIPQGENVKLDGFTQGSVPFIGNNKELAEDQSFFWDQTNKRLGLGTITPSFRLDVQDDRSATAAAQIYNTNTGPTAGGLILKLGTGTASTANKFLSFQTAAGEISSITGNGSNGIEIRLPAAFADWAEYIIKDQSETIPFGSLVCIKENGNATACDEAENKILGVASEHPTVIAGKNLGESSIAVGLTGIVKAFVSSQNGDIKPGDLITYSENPGVGVKATQKGMVAGRALEAYENSNVSQIGSILIVLQPNWYTPQVELTDKGDLIPQTVLSEERLALRPILSNIFENITTGFLEAKSISTGSLAIATDNITIGGQTLKEYIESIVNQAIETKTQELLAIQPKPQPSLISPVSETASNSAVTSIDDETKAKFSNLDQKISSLAANTTNIINIYNSMSTPSATNNQPARNASESVAGGQPTTEIASPSSNLLASQSFSDRSSSSSPINGFPRFEQGILAFGASSLTDVSVSGVLHVGQAAIFSENAINTLGVNLEIQPLRQGNLSIMGGLVEIDTEGNLKVSGNASFAGDVEIKGTLAANIIAPVPDSDLIVKLGTVNEENHNSFLIHNSKNDPVLSVNSLGDLIASGTAQFKNVATQGINIIRGAQADTSFTETVSSGSAGSAVITAYETERTIKTPFVKENSLIYIAPTSDTQGVTPYIARQVAETENVKGSFTIQISRPVIKNIKVNWWIIN